MIKAIRGVAISATFLLALLSPGSAAPPASCASKFVGSWSILIGATGERYPSQIRADGTVTSSCAFCSGVQSWTCEGNTFILLTPVTYRAALSPDGRQTVGHYMGGTITGTRVGKPPSAAPQTLASAQSPQHVSWCIGKDNPTPQKIAEGCTAVIKSGQSKGAALAGAHQNRALAYQRMEQFDSALRDFNEALRIAPNPMALVARGGFLVDRGELDRGIEDLKQAIQGHPGFALAHYNLGSAYFLKGEIESAIEALSQAVRIDPSYGPAYLNRGMAYLAVEMHDRAIEDATAAIDSLPKQAQPYVNRGIAYAKKGDFVHALQDLSQGIRLEPKTIYLNERAAIYSRSGQYDMAIADYSQSIKLEPSNAGVWNDRCWARALAGKDLDKAVADCNESLRLQPNTARSLDSRALVYLKLGKLDEALADYDAALDIVGYVPGHRMDPNFAGSLYSRGIVRQKKGDELGAAVDMAAAKAAKPGVADDVARYGVR